MKDELKRLFLESPDRAAHPYDSYRAIEELRHDAEKGLFMTEGAMNLLRRQERESGEKRKCGVCHRSLLSQRNLERCVKTLQAKRESVARMRHAEAQVIHDSCVAAMKEVCSKPDKELIASQHRIAYYLRDGELSEWRQQKIECMMSMGCFACSQKFTQSEIEAFLKRVDQTAAMMERELHVHPKFISTQKSVQVRALDATQNRLSPDVSKRCRLGKVGCEEKLHEQEVTDEDENDDDEEEEEETRHDGDSKTVKALSI